MEMFFAGTTVMKSLFYMLIVGYVLAKKGVITEKVNDSLLFILINVAVPSTIFKSVTTNPIKPNMILLSVQMLVFSFLFIFFGLFLGHIISKMFKVSKSKKGVIIMGLGFSNTVFMGLPVLSSFYGNDAAYFIGIQSIAFNGMVFISGNYFLSSEKVSFNIKTILTPPIYSLIVSLICLYVGFDLRNFDLGAFKSIEMLHSLTTPISLIIIGAFVSKVPLKELFTDKFLYFLCFIRLIVIPIISYFIVKIFINDTVLINIIVIMLAMPAATMVSILTAKCKGDMYYATKFVVLSTIFSIITVPIVIGIIHNISK